MIKLYPVKIEAHDEETGDLVFTMETFDEGAATIEIKTCLGPGNIDNVTAAMRRAIAMLELV